MIEEHVLEERAAHAAADLILEHALDLWVYRDDNWYVGDAEAPHVAMERQTVEFAPTVVDDLGALLDRAVKVVGVSDDFDAVARCEALARRLGPHVSAVRSQPYYLDITDQRANKGQFVACLARELAFDPEEIACIGDMPNDVQMFEACGLSIAMGNASDQVRQRAQHVTSPNTEEGFARAAHELVLPRAAGN